MMDVGTAQCAFAHPTLACTKMPDRISDTIFRSSPRKRGPSVSSDVHQDSRLRGNERRLFDLNAGTLDNVGPLRDLGFDERFYLCERHA